jgi:hypothetical protein
MRNAQRKRNYWWEHESEKCNADIWGAATGRRFRPWRLVATRVDSTLAVTSHGQQSADKSAHSKLVTNLKENIDG